MKKDAPHLPTNPMTDAQKEQWKRLKWFFAVLGFSLFVSIVATIVVTSWVLPEQVTPQTNIYTLEKPVSVEETTAPLSQLVLSQSQQRMVSVYNRQGKVGEYYRDDAYIGNALLLSAGGWAVMFADTTVPSSGWELEDFQGNRYRVAAVVNDPYIEGLQYIQISGDNFRGDSQFADWEMLEEGTILAAIGSDMRAVPVAISNVLANTPAGSQYRLTDIRQQYDLVGDTTAGDIILSDNGAFIGFTNADAQLLPGWYVETQLSALLATGKVDNSNISNQGFFVRQAVGNHPGFYVASGARTGNSSTLAVGDVVVKVDNQFLDELDVAEHVILSNDSVVLSVIRDEETQTLQISKQ